MSLASWAKKHLSVHLDSHTLGNLVKNASPVVGTVLGGPLGLAAAGGLSAVGDLGRGKNIGEAAKGSIGNVALAAGGQNVAGHFGYHGGLGSLTGGSSAAATPSPALPGAAPETVSGASPFNASGSIAGGSFDQSSSSPGLFSKALDFAKTNPTATAMGLNAVGNLATSGAQNRSANAQANLLEQQADESSYDFMRRKQREQDLAPLWGSLGTALGNGLHSAAPNPYLPTGA